MTDVDLNDLKIEHRPERSRSRMPVLLGLLLLAVGAGAGFALREYGPWFERPEEASEPPSGQSPATETQADPEKPPPPRSFTEGGWIEVPSYHPIVVSSLIPGRLEELTVLEGSRVQKGEVIARLYEKDLAHDLARARAEVAAAAANLARMKAGFRKQEIEKARADLAAAEAQVHLETRVLERTIGLLASGAASQEDRDRHETALSRTKSRRDALKQELLLKEEGSREEDIRAAEAEHRRRLATAELASNRLSYAAIKSASAGVVLQRFVTAGTYISAADPRIVSLYDPNDLQVRVDVRQENIGSVFTGQKVEVFTEVEPGRSYAGTVIRIDPLADFKKNTVQVKVKLHEPSERLYPEMIARIRFLLGKNDGKSDSDR